MVLAKDLVEREMRDLNWHRAKGRISDGNFEGLPVLKFVDNEHTNYFINSKSKKQGICLHYTEGYLGGDLSYLSRQDAYVSVPFLIGQSGTIVQMFDPDYWAYHLGNMAIGGNKRGSRSLIAIELNSVGNLSQSGNWMFTYWGNEYCRVSETQYYTKLPQPYRGEQYFAKFSEAQYRSLRELIGVLTRKYGIPNVFLPPNARHRSFDGPSSAEKYRGISSHVNYRRTGKLDIGPAFEWKKIGG